MLCALVLYGLAHAVVTCYHKQYMNFSLLTTLSQTKQAVVCGETVLLNNVLCAKD